VQLADEPGSNSKSRYTDQLLSLGRSAGLDQVGVTSAAVLHRAREAIYQRIEQGLHNQMQFTFRNPERSTDPTKTLPSASSVIVGALSYSSFLSILLRKPLKKKTNFRRVLPDTCGPIITRNYVSRLVKLRDN